MTDFGATLQRLREQRGFSQKELAKRVGVSTGTIGNYEAGLRRPKFETLEALADVFNVPMGVLLGDDEATRLLMITISKTIDLNQGTIDTPKTLSSIRQIYIQDDLLPLTRAVIAYNRKKNNILYLYSQKIFSSLTASQTGYDAYRKYLRETSERVLGRKITPHVLRHTHASLLAEQGLPYEAIAHRLGHENSRITKAIYIHITEKRKERENDMIRGVRLINFG